MERPIRKHLAFSIVAIISLILSLAGATRAEENAPPVALITGIRNKVTVIHNEVEMEGMVGKGLFEGDILRTGAVCQAVIMFGTGSELTLNENTEITIEDYRKKKGVFVKIGEVFSKILPRDATVIFRTPQGVAGIEGTEFNLKVTARESELGVVEGTVTVFGEQEKVMVPQNHLCTFKGPTFISPPIEVAKIPVWARGKLENYAITMNQIFMGLSTLRMSLKDAKNFSDENIANMISDREKLEEELAVVKPPVDCLKFQEMIRVRNRNATDYLKAVLEVRRKPDDQQAKEELMGSSLWVEADSRQDDFADEMYEMLKMMWETKMKGFMEKYEKQALK